MSDTAPLVLGFLDRLGDRVRLTDCGPAHVEVLRLRPELTTSPLFEPAVRRRADQLAGFHHPNCARTRQIGRLPAPDGRLVVVSDAIDGWRVSEVLEAIDRCGVAFHADAVLFLLRQLLGAVSALHQVAPGVSHGALGAERLILTAPGRLVVTESVLGAALRHLPSMSSDRLWRDLRLAVADGEVQPFGRLTDLRQIGVVALSLALGRQLRRDEYPARLASLLEEPTAAGPGRTAEALGPALRAWLVRVLSLSDNLTPWSVAEAQRELSRVVASDDRCAFAPTGLAELLSKVADYYDAAAEVAAPIHESSVPANKKVGPVLVRQPERVADQDPPTIREEPRVSELEPAGLERSQSHHPTRDASRAGVDIPPLSVDAPPPACDAPHPAFEVLRPDENVQLPAYDQPADASRDMSLVDTGSAPTTQVGREQPEMHARESGAAPSLLNAAIAAQPLETADADTLCDTPMPPGAVEEQPPPSPEADELLASPSPLAIFAMERETVQEPEPKIDSPAAAPLPISTTRRPSASLPTSTTRLAGASGHSPADSPADSPATGVAPLAEPIDAERSAAAVDRGDGRWRQTPSHFGSPSPRPLFGAHATDEGSDKVAASTGGRARMLVGIGAAAVVILALGGYSLLRPSSVNATSDRRASPSSSTAAANTAASPPAPSAATKPQEETPRVPSPLETPAALPRVAAPEGASLTGTIEVVSPVPLKVSEGGRALGASGEPILVPPGRHTLEIGNEGLGYRIVQVVDVKAGRPARIQPSLPSGAANLNATPWAEVWIDGHKLGETPLGNVPLTIGPHQVQFRHPDLGDQTRTLVVTMGAVAHLSVDLKK